MSDLAAAEAALRASGLPLGAPLVLLAETTSTNDLAKAAAREGAPHGSMWVAERQTAGRGRQGRRWTAAAGESLLFSVLLRTPCAPSRLPLLSLVAGLAVRDAIAAALATDTRVVVKWPNDVLVRDTKGSALRKISGVLVESMLAGSEVEGIVVGIGVNVHTRSFPDELGGRATSLALEGAPAPSRGSLLHDILAGLARDAPLVAASGLVPIHDRLSRADGLAGREVEVGGVRGIAEGIDREGRLLVRTPEGALVPTSSGEATVRGDLVAR